jgi:exonuclease SbcC
VILTAIRPYPFAGLADRRVAFDPGLNVLLGPNEAGKSTLVSALLLALFQRTRTSKREIEGTIARFLPAGRGDTIQVELRFSCRGEPFELQKSWGGTRSCRLSQGGAALTDDAAVTARLEELLGLRRGTVENVLVAPQAALPSTLRRFASDRAATEELAQLLRRALFETDGVSIERLGAAIAERRRRIFSRWDSRAGRPEGGRGVENPWKRDVGELLAAWYARERLRAQLEAALEHEAALDRLNGQVAALAETVARLECEVAEDADSYAGARERRTLLAELEALGARYDALTRANQAWPVLEKEQTDRQQEITELGASITALEEELARCQAYEESRLLRAQHEKAREKQRELVREEQELAALGPLEPRRLAELEEQRRVTAEAEGAMAAGKIRLRFTPREETPLKVQADLGDPAELVAAAGAPLDLEAEGRIQIDGAAWQLQVQTGELDLGALQERHRAATARIAALLDAMGLRDLAEAAAREAAVARQEAVTARLQNQLEGILGDHDFDALAAEAATLERDPPPRSTAEVAQELADVRSRLRAAEGALEEGDEQLAAWRAEHGSQEGLLDALLDVRARQAEKEQARATLPALPAGVEDSERFVEAFEARQRALERAREELSAAKLERAELDAPERTREEVEEALQEAEAAFERAAATGRALTRIQERFEAIRAELDADTMAPWLRDLEAVIAPLTGGRYRSVSLDPASGGGAGRADEVALPSALLSQGTRSCLGLALRLTMARRFLEDRRGFLVLDDPLVDMDPRRQQAAAELIRGFAAARQVIVTTCHPSHAELLGGHRVELDLPDDAARGR